MTKKELWAEFERLSRTADCMLDEMARLSARKQELERERARVIRASHEVLDLYTAMLTSEGK